MPTQSNPQFAFDAALQLADGSAPITASGAGTVSGSAYVFDTMAGAPGLGSPPVLENIRYGANVVTSVSSVTGGGSDQVTLQASNDPTFATGVVTLAITPVITLPGVYAAPFTNQQGGTTHRYLRITDTIAGGATVSRVVFLSQLDALGFN